ncbi:MAG: hypothetical protein WC862_05045 [Patescibacteria group bacterium]
METVFTKILQRVSRVSLYSIVLLMPLFFLNITFEKMELGKYMLFYALTIISFLSYLIRIIILKGVTIRRTHLDIGIIVLWFAFLLSSILSKERFISFFGDFSFMGLSFLGITIMIIFFFLIVQHADSLAEAMKVIYLLLASGALSAVYFIITATKLLNLPEVITWPAFNLAHGTNSLFGVFMIIIFVLSLTLLAIRTKSLALDGFALAVFLLSGAAMLLIGFKVVIMILAAAIFFMLVFFLSHLDWVRRVWGPVVFTLFIAVLLMGIFRVPSFLTANLPLEIALGRGVSWNIARDTITSGVKTFLFGRGSGTFGYAFSEFRPSVMNLNVAWNVRFKQPNSSALGWLADHGVFASLAFLGIVLMLLGSVITVWIRHVVELNKKKKIMSEKIETEKSLYDSPLLYWGLVSAWIVIAVSFFFVYFGALHWMLFWLFSALVASSSIQASKLQPITISLKTTPQYTLIVSFSFIFIFAVIIVASVFVGRFYAAEVLYASSVSQEVDVKIQTLQKALGMNPNHAMMNYNLAEAFLSKAASVSQSGGDINQVYQMVGMAVDAAKKATEISPYNAAMWQNLSRMYENARNIAPDANTWVISSLERALRLEPSNPVLYMSLANARLLGNDYDGAKTDLEKAIELKPDLLVAYVRLAMIEQLSNNLDGAIAAMERGLPYRGLQNAEYLLRTGILYFNRNNTGDYPLSEIAFRRALSLNPNYSDALYALGHLYDITDHKNLALPIFEKVLELNPGNQDVQNRVDSIKKALKPAPQPEPAAEEDSGEPEGE